MAKDRNIVLVGGGHAHLEVVRSARRLLRLGAELTLVDPGDFHYSGMATGLVGGDYELADLTVDLQALAGAHGVRHRAGAMVGLDRQNRTVRLADGSQLHYDWLSLNIGSTVNRSLMPASEELFGLKPLSDLRRLRVRVQDWPTDQPLTVGVIGGGIGGCELAANLASLLVRHGGEAPRRVALIEQGGAIARQLPNGAATFVRDCLSKKQVEVLLNAEIVAQHGAQLQLADGRQLNADLLVLATGLVPPTLTTQLQLPAGPGGIRVNTTLRTTDDRIFAIGDCADIARYQLPKVGVYGVRAATTLIDNLQACLVGSPLQHYLPQARFLSILNLSDGIGLAWRGNRWWHGRTAWWLKQWIDRRFVERYRV